MPVEPRTLRGPVVRPTVGGRAAVLAAAVLAAIVASACTGHPQHGRSTTTPHSAAPTPSSPAAAPVVRKEWQRDGIRPVSGVRIVGGTAFVYEARAQWMFLRAFDPTTGNEYWDSDASTGAQPSGEFVNVSVVGDQVVFFKPDDPSDPQSSRLVFTTPGHSSAFPTIQTDAREWRDLPTACGTDVCTSAWQYDTATKTWNTHRYRINPHTGTSRLDAGAGYRGLGSDLVDLLDRNPEKVARISNGRTVWVRTLADLAGPDVSTDNGWDTNQFQHGAVTTLTVYRNQHVPIGARDYRANLASSIITVAVDTQTGKLLWRHTGESVGCEFHMILPDAQPIRCTYSGYEHQHFDPPAATTTAPPTSTEPEHLDVALQRFDPRTGATVWSLPLGAAATLAGYSEQNKAPVLSDTQILAAGHVIDLTTGAQRPPTSRDVFWCPQDTEFQVSPIPDPGETESATRVGEGVVTLCTAAGKPTTALPTALPTQLIDVAGNLHIVATPTGLIAYRTL